MVISHQKKFIFIHNYKVAGSSIKQALDTYNDKARKELNLIDRVKVKLGLFPNVFSEDFVWHTKASDIKAKIPEEIFDTYFKFGFVRNPWDWQVSLYKYMLIKEDHHQHDIIKSMKGFDEYIEWRVSHDNLNLQKDFFYENDTCLVDFIGKMENLKSDFSKICDEIGVTAELPHVNSSGRSENHFKELYSQRSVDLIYEAFQPDIELFNYSKPVL